MKYLGEHDFITLKTFAEIAQIPKIYRFTNAGQADTRQCDPCIEPRELEDKYFLKS